jgi:Uma2 family endonuclease
MVTTSTKIVADLEAMGSEAKRFEVIGGMLRPREPMGAEHGEIEVQLLLPLGAYVLSNGLGRVYPSETHFIILDDPEELVVPDLSFVRADRLPPRGQRKGFLCLVPDLVVEVVSPSDRETKVREKIGLYQRAGVPLIWLIREPRRTVTVYPFGAASFTLRETDSLDGGDVVRGFRLPVARLFE